MNRRQQLAINAKLKEIFARKEKDEFLSFPPQGGSVHEYAADELDIMTGVNDSDNLKSSATLEKLCEFAQLVNHAPRGNVFYTEDDEMLWTVYKDIMKNAETTVDELTPEEQKEYDKATDFLFVKEDGIITSYSDIYNRYLEYNDKYYDTLERGGDLARVTAEWESLGYKAKVEATLATYNQLNMKYPSLYFANEQNKWDENVVLQTTLVTKQRFAPTYIFPANVYKQEWNQVTLNKSDIERLIDNAVKEGESNVDEEANCRTIKISFECRSVKVDRPWMNKTLLRSRNWRFNLSSDLQPLACEGSDLTVGRFPAYVASLVLVRNIVIEQEVTTQTTVGSGRVDHPSTIKMQILEEERKKSEQPIRRPTIPLTRNETIKVSNELTRKETIKVGNEGCMSVMVYICKRFPAPCPNPDATANWIGGLKTAKFTLTQTDGGRLEARINGEKVGSNSYPQGQTVTLTAIPDSGHVLDAWIINSKKTEFNGYELTKTIPKEGLTVEAIWKTGKGNNSGGLISLSKDGKTLLKCNITDSDINMNDYAQLSSVTTIAAGAFENNDTLHKIRISTQVRTIEDRAFGECSKLQEVILPAAVLNIASAAFERKNSLKGPLFVVDPANESYVAVDGVLTGKEHVGKVRQATCSHCRTTFFVPADNGTLPACPKCAEPLEAEREETVVMPDFYIPFKVNEVEARKKIQSYIQRKNFVLKEFVAAANEQIELHQTYLPYWEYDVTADSDYTAKIKKVTSETVKNSDGTTSQKEHVSYEDKTGHVFNEFQNVTVVASKMLNDNVPNLSAQAKMTPSVDWWNSGAAFELYAVQPGKSLEQFKSTVDNKVDSNIQMKINDNIQSVGIDTIFKKLQQRLVMRPVWMGAVTFNGKRYPVFADGVTGQVEKKTECAIDTKKRNRTYAIIAGVVIVIAVIIWLLLR